MRPLEKLHPPGWFYDTVVFKYLGYEVFYFSGVGSLIILVYIIQSGWVKRLLEHSMARFLGKISYGVYLMHWLVVVWVFNNRPWLSSFFPSEKIAFACLMLASIVVTIVLAIIMHHIIELPFIKLGKNLAAKMPDTLVINPVTKQAET